MSYILCDNLICMLLWYLIYLYSCVNVFTAVRWLRSATITIPTDNRTVSVSCDVNESNPPVKCRVIINCTTCELIISREFTGSIQQRVMPQNSYSICVQVIIAENGTAVDDYNILQTISVPERNTNSGIISCKLVILLILNLG